jgi:hypothetical protein
MPLPSDNLPSYWYWCSGGAKLLLVSKNFSMKQSIKIPFIFFAVVITFFHACKKDLEPVTTTPPPPPVLVSSEKKITSFAFLKKDNPALEFDAVGEITGTAITVELIATVTTRNLIATFFASEKASVSLAAVKQVSGVTSVNYASKVTFEVEAEDKSKTNYTVEIKSVGNAPLSTVNNTTSYALETLTKTWIHYGNTIPQSVGYWPTAFLARTFFDFDKDGDEDLLMGTLNYDKVNNALVDAPFPVNYLENRAGKYVDVSSSAFMGSVPGLVHPRKAILGDFDKNGWMDVVISGQGYDAPPFPGEKSVFLKNSNGKFTNTFFQEIGFHHSVCSGDIDNDGDLDLFFTDPKRSRFYTNNGSGVFTFDNTILASDITYVNFFTSELYDLNADGYLDLIATGHEHEGAVSTVFWGSYTGKFSREKSTALPKVNGWGVAIDINILDVNKDGKQDIILNRQGDGTGTQRRYYGCYIQILMQEAGNKFVDKTATLINGNPQLSHPGIEWFWVDWIRPFDTDGDGDYDLVADDRFNNLQWRNDNGVFVKY